MFVLQIGGRIMKRKALICAALAACMVMSGCSDELSALRTHSGIIYNYATNGEATRNYKTAIQNGNIEWIKEIIANNPSLDRNYCDDTTAIYCAYWHSNIGETRNTDDGAYYKYKVISKLIDLGVNPDIGSQLQLSTFNKKYWYTKALLTSDKINLYTENDIGNSALDMALHNHKGGCGLTSAEQVFLMTEAGAKPEAKIFWDDNADEEDENVDFHYSTLQYDPVGANYLINLLLDSGQESGLKPAIEYAVSGQIDKVLEEFEKEGTGSYKSYEKYIIQLYSACYGTPELVEQLKKYLSFSDTTGMLWYSAETGNLEMVKYLMNNYDYNISGDDYDGFKVRAFEFANQWGHSEISKYFCDNNVHLQKSAAGYNDITDAVYSEDLETVKVVYEYIKSQVGFDEKELGLGFYQKYFKNYDAAKEIIDFFSDEGYDFRYVLFEGFEKELAEYLYAKGRPLNPSDLQYAILSGDPDFVEMVLNKGADPDQPVCVNFHPYKSWDITDSGESISYEQFNHANDQNPIIFYAIKFSNSEVVKKLIDYGVDLEARHNTMEERTRIETVLNGCTPLQYCIYGSAATLRALLDAGADRTIMVDEMIGADGIVRKNGPYSLEQFFEFYGRSDLAQIVRDYQNEK